ncbi:MAG: hypothetical protein VKL39_01880 [Leptolyngbyaceae bacterium]|nr:hypothetical protein [Leptolyngbyaceae bacterium]
MANAFAILGRNTTKPFQADLAEIDSARAQARANLSHAKLYEQQAAKAAEDRKLEQETINAFKQMGMNPTPEAIAQLNTVNPMAAQKMQEAMQKRALNEIASRKAAFDAQEAQLKAQRTAMETALSKGEALSQILSTVQSPEQLFSAAQRALEVGALTREQAIEMVQTPWEKFVADQPQIVQMGQTIKERMALSKAEFDQKQAQIQAERDALLFPAKQAAAEAQAKIAQNQTITTAPNAQGLTPAQVAENQRAAQQQAFQAAEAEKNRAVQLRGQNITMRGQDMVDERAAEQREQKPLNEYETRNFGFFDRARQATEVLGKLDENIRQKNLFGQARLKMAPNILQSEENQQYNQAKRQFIAAYLRRDSGAVITDDEMKQGDETFFVQPGDTKSVIDQKRKARETVLNALKVGAGRAPQRLGVEDEPKGASGPAPSSLREIIRGADGKLVFKK